MGGYGGSRALPEFHVQIGGVAGNAGTRTWTALSPLVRLCLRSNRTLQVALWWTCVFCLVALLEIKCLIPVSQGRRERQRTASL